MGRLTCQRQCVDLVSEAGKFAAAIRELDPDTPVPTCPEWTVAVPVAHVHRGSRWRRTHQLDINGDTNLLTNSRL